LVVDIGGKTGAIQKQHHHQQRRALLAD